MSGLLGVPGAMVELPYRGGLSTATDRPVAFARTLGGKRKAFVGSQGRREWDVSFDLIGSKDTHGLLAVAKHVGPVSWYPADAAAGNLLSPQATSWSPVPANGADAGLAALPDQTVSRALTHVGTGLVYVGGTGEALTWELVHVTPGHPITVGIWAMGGVRITGSWRNAAGTHISTPDSGVRTASGWKFHTATFTPPMGATHYAMALSAGTQYARPSVARGSTAKDLPGRGCPRAVVHGLSEALTLIAVDDAYGSVGVTITEVG